MIPDLHHAPREPRRAGPFGRRSLRAIAIAFDFGRVLAFALALAWVSPTTAAAPSAPDHFTHAWWSGLEYSDNRLRTQTARLDDLLFVPRVSFSLLQSGARWRSHGVGEMQLERSIRGGDDENLRARLQLSADLALSPQRAYWAFRNFADVQSIDPLAADGPDNRQQTNVFATGPVFLLGHPRTLTSRIEASYARSYAEETSASNQDRYSLMAWVHRQSDPIRGWSLGVESSDVRLRDRDAGSDYRRHDALLRYDHALPDAGLRISAGRTWIELANGDSYSRPSLRASWRWSTGGGDEFGAEFADELSDSSRDLATAIEAGDPLRPEVHRALIGAELYRLRSAELRWLRRSPRSQGSLTPFARDYDYIGDDGGLQRRSRGIRATADLAISPLLSLIFEAGTERFDFHTTARRDRDSYATLFASLRLTPNWSVRSGIGRYVRGSNAPEASYRENTLSVFLVRAGGR